MFDVIKVVCDSSFFAGFIACIYCTLKWLWLCIRHKEDIKGRKQYSTAAFILGAVSGGLLIASFAIAVQMNG